MKDFLTDEEMEKAAPAADFISDKDMEAIHPTPKDEGALSGAWRGLKEGVGAFTAAGQEMVPFSGALDKASAASTSALQGLGGSEVPFSERYHKNLDELDKFRNEEKAKSPLMAKIGSVVGGATALAVPIPGSSAAGIIPAISRIAGNAGMAALEQGTSNPDKLFDPEKAEHAATLAGMLGMGGETLAGLANTAPARQAADYLGKKKKAIGDWMEKWANEKAFRAATGNQSAPWDEAMRYGVLQQRGRDLRHSGVVGFGNSASEIAEKAGVAKQNSWEKMQQIMNDVDSQGANAVSGQNIGSNFVNETGKVEGLGNEGLVNQSIEKAAKYEDMGNIPMSKAQQEKNSFVHRGSDNPHINDIAKRSIGDEMDAAVNRTSPELGNDWVNAKTAYGTNAAAEDDASVAASRYAKNNAFSIGDKFMALLGAHAAGGHGLTSLGAAGLAAGANKLVRKRGDSAAAATLGTVGEWLQKSPEKLGEYQGILSQAASKGKLPFELTHFMLMEKDPSYRQMMESND